jgi:hypothetical protein
LRGKAELERAGTVRTIAAGTDDERHRWCQRPETPKP